MCSKAKLNCSLGRIWICTQVGTKSLAFLQPTTRDYTARTSAGLSRLTKPHDEREIAHHRRLWFCPEGDSSPSIEERQRLHRERHSAQGRRLHLPVTAFRRSISRTGLASKVTQSINKKWRPTKREVNRLHSRRAGTKNLVPNA